MWALSQISAFADRVIFSVSTEQTPGSLAGLDEALRRIEGLEDVELDLLPTQNLFSVSTPVELAQRLWVSGQGQIIQLAETLSVTEFGLVIVSNVTLRSFGTLTKAFQVRGALMLDHCYVERFQAPLIWLYGSANLAHMHISYSTETTVLVKSGKAVLDFASVSVSQLSASLVTLSIVESPKTPFTISVAYSEFEDNADRPTFALYKAPGKIRVEFSSFARNLGLVLDISGSALQVIFESCQFRDSNSTILSLKTVSEAEVRISNCSFMNNFDITVATSSFSGQLTIEECTVTQQRGAEVLRLLSDNSVCSAVIRNFYICDINSVVESLDPQALISVSRCNASFSGLKIANVSALVAPYANPLILSQFANIWLSNTTVVDSKTNGFVMNSHFSLLHMSDFLLDNFYSTGEVSFAFIQNTVYIQRMTITKGTSNPTNRQTVFLYPTMNFISLSSTLEAHNISVSDARGKLGPCFNQVFSDYSISNIRLSRISTGSVLLAVLSSGSISEVQMDQIVEYMPAFLVGDGVTVVSNITILNSQLDLSTVLGLGKATLTFVNNFTIKNCSIMEIVALWRAIATISSLHLENCTVSRKVLYIVDSEASIKDFTMRESRLQRLTMSRSNVTIEDAVFASLSFQDFFWVIANSNVSFLRLRAVNINATTMMGSMTTGSFVAMEKCTFKHLRVKKELGWQVSESALYISNTQFRFFNFGCFQAMNSNITLLSSIFEGGRNPIRSLRSDKALGGALSCVDCPLVTIKDSRFLNLSAIVGGAVAVKRRFPLPELLVVMERSEFLGCSAQQAGALFLQNISFTIDASAFVANAAERSGGGIFASIKPWHNGYIRNSILVKNSAQEGGAVKWSNAPILFTNVTFQENSAAYGPDIASYGVRLSSALTRLTGTESSGYGINVVFALLDHYRNPVTLSPFKFLMLSSTSTVAYRGNSGTILKQGLFNFSEVTIYAPPASTQVIQAVLNDTQEDYTRSLVGEVTIDFRHCKAGEIQRSDRCEYCHPGNFSFSPLDANCAYCPENAFCPGGNELVVNSGYWRTALNSSIVVACSYPVTCLGGLDSTCLSGFTGVLCTQCAADAYRVRAAECVNCQIWPICGPIVMLLFLRWVVLRLEKSPNSLFIVKIVIRHLQYLSALCFLRVSYSDIITWSLRVVNWFSALLIPDLPLACLGLSNPEYAKALVGSLLLPALLVLDFLLCKPGQKGVLASSLVFYTPYITLLTTVPLFVCQKMQSSELLFFDMDVVCWQGSHSKYTLLLVLPSLLINIAGPIAAVLAVRLFRPLLFGRYFPLWTVGYACSIYDVLQSIWQGIFLCVIITTTTLVPLLQVAYSLTVLIAACTLNVFLYQFIYLSNRHFLIAETSFVTIALSQGFLSYYLFYLPGSSGTEFFVSAMFLLLNAAFLGLCGWSLANNCLEGSKAVRVIESNRVEEVSKVRNSPAASYSPALFAPPNSLSLK